MFLVPDRVLSLAVLILLFLAMHWQIILAKGGKAITIRRIAGLDAIPEAVGRATELGRPVHYTCGIGALDNEFGPQTLAGLGLLQYVAKLCAKYNTRIINTVSNPVVFPLSQEMVKLGFLEAGRPEAYTDDMVRFLSSDQFAYAGGAMATMNREQAAANIMIGAFYAEALLIAEAGFQAGAIQVGSTARMYQLPFFFIVCDYVLIGEEMFAASAYVSRDPDKLGALAGQDIGKVVSFAVLGLGAILATFKINVISELLTRYGK